MDTDKLFEDIPIFVLIAVLVLMRIAPPAYRDVLFWGGMVSAIVFVVGTEYLFRITASKFLYIQGIVRPTGEMLHMFIKEPMDGIHSREIDRVNHIYETPLTLGENLRLRKYLGVRQVVLEHVLTWEKRFIALPGRAMFRGYSVEHPRTAKMILWTPKEGQTIIDHAEPIPVFMVAEAPRDYYLATDPVIVESPGTDLQAVEKGSVDVQTVRNQLDSEKIKNRELERQNFTLQRNIIRIEGMLKQIKNEFRGALSRTRDTAKLVLEELLTVASAHSEIEEAVNEYRKRPWITITIGLALLVLGIFGIYEYGYNQDFRAGIQQNEAVIIVLAVCAVFIVMFMYGRRSKRQ